MEGSAVAGSVAGLWRYPVKSMLGEELREAQVTERGFAGDRAYALLDMETGKVVSAKSPRKWARMFELRACYQGPAADGAPATITFPDGRTVASDDPQIDRMLSEALGRPVRLASEPPAGATYESVPVGSPEGEMTQYPLPNRFFDLGALHLVTTASLERLRELYPEGRFEVRRFRPNIVVETPEGEQGFVENGWVGKTLAIGDEVRARVIGPAIRCVMTTLAQGDLPKDASILRTAAQHNHANVGVYADVIAGGAIRRGDPVTLA